MSIRKLIVLALFLTLILSACGGNASPTATPAPTTPPVTAESNITPTQETTVEATEAVANAGSTDEAATAEAESVETGSADGVVVTITQIDTSLRAGPGTAYAVVARATVNDSFPAVARYGEGRSLWYQVTLPDGTLAWTWSRVSTLIPAEAELPTAVEIPPTPAA